MYNGEKKESRKMKKNEKISAIFLNDHNTLNERITSVKDFCFCTSL